MPYIGKHPDEGKNWIVAFVSPDPNGRVEALKRYKHKGTAERHCPPVHDRYGYKVCDYTKKHCRVMSLEEYVKLASEEVVVRSLMSGGPVKISRSEVGGCCDPSTETYWSM